MTRLAKLLSIGSEPLCSAAPAMPAAFEGTRWAAELEAMLAAKNGFFAFESSLHVFPAGPTVHGYDLATWNDPRGWRAAYPDLPADLLLFAEDVFGIPFCCGEAGVQRFDPETGALEQLATTLEDWAALVLAEFAFQTGHPLAHAWQVKHGPLAPTQRLAPKVPFVLGGAYELDNLYAADALESMRFRADLARQIRDLPDGARVKLVVGD
ncbi:MAG TPA: hypothetical protein VD838_04550 [Anaeromyxobacteraceae bacterium]|nr:hypothetical protein [Anaeromyxobacteraceae bacterium]